MLYMLDTNIVSYRLNGKIESVHKHLLEHNEDDLCISSIVFAELCFGVINSSNPNRNQLALDLFLSSIDILPFDDFSAIEYSFIRKSLSDSGLIIGSNDLLIAAHAKSVGAVLVTHNTREFERVDGLMVEDWAIC